MLHPVGDLPASVYWRRRVVVLAVLLAVPAGAGWSTVALLDRADAGSPAAAATSASGSAVPTPALERVVPSLAGVRTPDPRAATPSSAPRPPATTAPPAGPAPGSRCTDDMVELAVDGPAEVSAGSKPTLEIVLRNVAAVPCVRAVDKELQEIVLLDAAGTRVWGSNDCFPEQSDQSVTLQPGEAFALPLVWGGRTSAPGCAGGRAVPPPGDYALRARLDTKTSADRPLTLT